MTLSLHDLIAQQFGVRTREELNPVTATVGVAAEVIMRADSSRLAAVIVNLSVNTLYVLPGGDVSSTRGIYVAPGGGSVTLRFDQDFSLPGREWWGIAGAAASSVLVVEVLSETLGRGA